MEKGGRKKVSKKKTLTRNAVGHDLFATWEVRVKFSNGIWYPEIIVVSEIHTCCHLLDLEVVPCGKLLLPHQPGTKTWY